MPDRLFVFLLCRLEKNKLNGGIAFPAFILTLIATALFFYIKSLPQVTLNLVAQVT
jgi:hypothetical protein